MNDYNVSKQELEAVLKLSPEKRYEYFIKKICDWEYIWTLDNQDDPKSLVCYEDKKGKLYIYLFPFKEFAYYYIQKENDMDDCSFMSITLKEFTEEILDKLQSKNVLDALVFPAPQGYGLNVSLEQLKKDIEQEMEENY